MWKKDNKNGFTLIEVLVAILIVGLVLTAVASLLSASVKNSSQADYRVVASRFGQEVIDRIRQRRSSVGWSTFYSELPSGDTCLHKTNYTFKSKPCTGTEYVVSSNSINFTRELNIQKNTDNVQLTVRVVWKDGSLDKDVVLTQKLYDY